MSRCARAGREQSQAASPSWQEEIFHAMGITLSLQVGVGWGAGTQSFSMSLLFFREFCDHCSWTGYAISHRTVRKIVLSVACFA